MAMEREEIVNLATHRVDYGSSEVSTACLQVLAIMHLVDELRDFRRDLAHTMAQGG